MGWGRDTLPLGTGPITAQTAWGKAGAENSVQEPVNQDLLLGASVSDHL